MDPSCTASKDFPLDVELSFSIRNSSVLKQKVTTAFELLHDPVYRYLFRVLEDPHEAEDLAQEVFLRLYAYLQKGHTVTSTRAWVFRVAHNLAIDHQTRKIQFEPINPAAGHEVHDPAPSAEQRVLDAEQRRRLREAVAGLSIKEKHCLELRAEGLSYKEIAEILDMRMPTLVKYLGRIIRKLVNGTAYA